MNVLHQDKTNWFFKAKELIIYTLLYVLCLVFSSTYFHNHYEVQDLHPTQLIIKTSVSPLELVVYGKSNTDSEINFKLPLLPQLINDELVVDVSKHSMRSFRIYFGKTITKNSIKAIRLVYTDEMKSFGFEDFRKNALGNWQVKGTLLEFSPNAESYLEPNKAWLSKSERLFLIILILIITFPFAYALQFILKSLLNKMNGIDLNQLSISLFLLSIFLPHPIYNVVFVLSFLYGLRHFDYKRVLSNPIAMLFIVYFLYLLGHYFFEGKLQHTGFIETLIPLFFIPFYLACYKKCDAFVFLPAIAVIIGLCLFVTSLQDAVVFQNLNYFSFDLFSHKLHPIYYSYLVVFSIIYLELNRENNNKLVFYRIVLNLILLLIGSKLAILFVILFYVVELSTLKLSSMIWYALVIITLCFAFKPTRSRFLALSKVSDFGVLKEHVIQSSADTRINGITLRLILWQESLSCFQNTSDYIFGLGIGHGADRKLEQKLLDKGLDPVVAKYDPHNQYIAALYKSGMLGLLILLSVLLLFMRKSILQRNKLMIYSGLLVGVSWMAESSLQRAVGVYFFCTLFILLYSEAEELDKIKA